MQESNDIKDNIIYELLVKDDLHESYNWNEL